MAKEVSIDGLEELQKALKDNATMSDVKRVVRKNGADLNRLMTRKADFKRGYQTGQTKRSIHMEIEDSGFSASVGPTTEYAPYLEYGTRFMDAQPFVYPSLDEQTAKFKADMKKLVK